MSNTMHQDKFYLKHLDRQELLSFLELTIYQH